MFPEENKMTDYVLLCEQMRSLTEGERHWLPSLSNASALLYDALPDLNWAGFYLMEGGSLLLGPFQGRAACIRIPLGRGVCGTAAAEDRTLLVPDVHAFPGHIACDCASNAEIVVPLRRDGRVIGVLDLDSPLGGRFTEEDRAGLEAFARVLEEEIAWKEL